MHIRTIDVLSGNLWRIDVSTYRHIVVTSVDFDWDVTEIGAEDNWHRIFVCCIRNKEQCS